MFSRPAIALFVTFLVFPNCTRAAITYVSQDRYVGVGLKQERTSFGVSMGAEERPPSIQTFVQAPDFGPFSATLTNPGNTGGASLVSTLEPSHLIATGSTFGGLISTGNLYQNWGYGIARNIIVFDVDEPTGFALTPFPNLAPPLRIPTTAKFSGPNGQEFVFKTTPQGTLVPGRWTLALTTDSQLMSAGPEYAINLVFTPEPSTAPVLAAAFLARRRRRTQS